MGIVSKINCWEPLVMAPNRIFYWGTLVMAPNGNFYWGTPVMAPKFWNPPCFFLSLGKKGTGIKNIIQKTFIALRVNSFWALSKVNWSFS